MRFMLIVYPENYPTAKAGWVPDLTDIEDLRKFHEEMGAAGVRVFVGGLLPAREAKSLRAQPDGKVLTTDGPYLETKEHIGGFWVLEVADLEAALAWGRKAVIACRVRWKCARLGYQPRVRDNVRSAKTEKR